jgi:hypothetical protein
VAEALRAGSRLERIGMVENLISEQNITDLADLMKVSDQLPPVLMREYRAPGDLMAVFTRPAARASCRSADFAFVADDAAVLTALLKQRRCAQGARRQRAAVRPARAPARPNWPRSAPQPPGSSCTRSNTPTATATACRARPLSQPADQPGVPEGQPAVALLFDEVEDVFPPISSEAAQLIARLDSSDGAAAG